MHEFPQRLRAIFPVDGEAMIGLPALGEQITTCYDSAILPAEVNGHHGGALDSARRGATIQCRATASAGSNGNGDGNADGNGRHVTVTVHAPAASAVPVANPWTPSTLQ